MSDSKPQKFQCGVITLYNKETLKKMGYNINPTINYNVPHIVYCEDIQNIKYDNTLLFIKINNTYKVILPSYINKYYSTEEGKEKFPELFI